MILYAIGFLLAISALVGMNFFDTNFNIGLICAIFGIFMMQFGNRVIESYDEE